MASTMLTIIFIFSTLVIAEGTHFTLNIQTEDVWASSLFYQATDGLSFATRAVDGNYDTDYSAGSTFASSTADGSPYFDIFMAGYYEVYSVTITNRGDLKSERLHDIDILVYNYNPLVPGEVGQKCGHIGAAPAAGSNTTVVCSDHPAGFFIRIKKTQVDNDNDLLQFVEVSAEVDYPYLCTGHG